MNEEIDDSEVEYNTIKGESMIQKGNRWITETEFKEDENQIIEQVGVYLTLNSKERIEADALIKREIAREPYDLFYWKDLDCAIKIAIKEQLINRINKLK